MPGWITMRHHKHRVCAELAPNRFGLGKEKQISIEINEPCDPALRPEKITEEARRQREDELGPSPRALHACEFGICTEQVVETDYLDPLAADRAQHLGCRLVQCQYPKPGGRIVSRQGPPEGQALRQVASIEVGTIVVHASRPPVLRANT